MFEEVLYTKKVRNGVYAYKYLNGNINIQGVTYIYYSMSEAIKRHRRNFPKYKK